MRRNLVWLAQIAAMSAVVMLLAWLGCGPTTKTPHYDYSRHHDDPVGTLFDELFRVHPEYRRPAFIVGGFLVVMIIGFKIRPRD